ncbi:MAG TPA: AIR synthase related protein, partial [Acidimicrobiales bacterium]|nr:AIR synthase related protein [Acidimicrobiales bacterium]
MTAGGAAGGEFAILDRLRHRLPGPPAGEVWIGDDAAVVRLGPGLALLTTDMSVAGIHADLALVDPDDLGWRAVAVSLSDIAAMGGTATHLVVAAAGPPATDMDLLLAGVAEAAESHRCPIVGGDLSAAEAVTVVVSVVGRVDDEPGPVLRGGARAGDRLFVT